MKVYVITKGIYSDYHICAVAIDKAKAEQLVEKFSDSWDKAEIEEYDTEDYNPILRFQKCFNCFYHEENKTFSLTETDSDYLEADDFKPKKNKESLFFRVLANDENMALKKASDIVAQYKAEKMDL